MTDGVSCGAYKLYINAKIFVLCIVLLILKTYITKLTSYVYSEFFRFTKL